VIRDLVHDLRYGARSLRRSPLFTATVIVTLALGIANAAIFSLISVRWLVLRQAFGLGLAGVVVGLPAAVAVARLLRGFLFGLGPMDPAALLTAGLLMFAVATLAACLPARQAAAMDPMVALRSE
jgi:putative ABC transport system permease protein